MQCRKTVGFINDKEKNIMSLGITWYTLAEAEGKLGLKQSEIPIEISMA